VTPYFFKHAARAVRPAAPAAGVEPVAAAAEFVGVDELPPHAAKTTAIASAPTAARMGVLLTFINCSLFLSAEQAG
jgi:hypothetical protein